MRASFFSKLIMTLFPVSKSDFVHVAGVVRTEEIVPSELIAEPVLK